MYGCGCESYAGLQRQADADEAYCSLQVWSFVRWRHVPTSFNLCPFTDLGLEFASLFHSCLPLYFDLAHDEEEASV